jgi:hypothetical protein
MQCNVGTADKTIRLIVGAAIIGAGVYYQNWLGAIGLVPVLTALMGWCPAYTLIGASTCKKQDLS